MSDMINNELAEAISPAKKIETAVDAQAEVSAPVEDTRPIYKMMPETRIAVSDQYGKTWQARINAASDLVSPFRDGWDEATKYYQNDQLNHRTTIQGNSSGNASVAKRINEQWSETENIVFANIQAIIPAIYAKNPTCEMTRQFAGPKDREQQDEDIARLEKLMNTLANMDRAPGFNLKPVAKQGVVCAKLTNIAWMEVGYTMKQDSSEQALQNLLELEKKLEAAKDAKEISEVEGSLQALADTIDMLQQSGPFRRLVNPRDVLIDPDTREPDFSDRRWMAVRDYIPTNYLNAKYGEKDADTGQFKSIYKPSHVLAANNGVSSDDLVTNFKLFSKDNTPQQFGYLTMGQLQAAQRTEVWKIWDKTTRRVYMYAQNDWTWPIWVWNDPYELPNFFPFRPLYYNVAAAGAYAKGEVTYYLDQQDAINEINDEFRRARNQVKRNVLFNKKLDPASVAAVLNGPDGTAKGVDLPDGTTFEQHFWSPPVNIAKYPMLFDKADKFAAIDRISGVGITLRNEQFKTNTTNEAISKYEATTATRLDAQIDPIEDWLGAIFNDLAFLCLRFMTIDQVADVIGPEMAKGWRNYNAREAANFYNVRIVGGSTLKPTSQAKKREAIEVARVLGQFVQAAPGATVKIILRMFKEAFDGINVESSDIVSIEQESSARMSRGGPGGAQGGGGEGGGGMPPEIAAMMQQIDQLPPEAKIALGQAMARGVPVMEAVQQLLANLKAPQTTQ